ncbi:uncharacterized protein PAE49_011528 [Odontesthes bonariensis]|uniref:uncharacterized protein LOC142390168 n=1 Tax=Odontesthes bonariensis TaxID=219752 RepID=UPI003F583AB3
MSAGDPEGDPGPAALHASYMLCALLCLQMRSTLSLLVMVLSEGRRQRRVLLECALSETAALLHLVPAPAPRAPRACWMRVRSKDWWERVVLTEFSDAEWRQNFRMTRGSFDKLCALMEPVLSPQDVTVRAPIPLQMRVAIVLYKLVSCAEYRAVATKFGVHKTTVKKFMYSFCRGMVASVVHGLIQLPSAHEARAMARRFEQKFGIPQVMGCIHRTHVPVLPPSDAFEDFVNPRGWPSYVLQAVVDDTHRFWNINCKMPGSTPEADVLRQSALFHQAHLLPKDPIEINGTSVNLLLLGNPAYPMTDWLIKDFPRSITSEQESFNVRLSSVRTSADVAFRRLKSRWRVLLRKSDFHYTFTPYVVATCCALHNFCESVEEEVDPAWTEDAALLERDLPQPAVVPYDDPDGSEGQRIRSALSEHLNRNSAACELT